MARRAMNAGTVPTPGPWIVRGAAEASASATDTMHGVEPATPDPPGGSPYLICQDPMAEPGDIPLPIATDIHRLADARLMAAAPELAHILFRLLTSPDLMRRGLDPQTRAAIILAWDLLVQAAPHLEI